MRENTIRVGLVGVGAIAQVAHLPAYQKTKALSVVALCDSDEKKTGVVAERYGIKKVYRDYRELLDDREVDVVDVCVPNFLHFDVVTKAIEAGKDVICEKPLSLNADQARKIVELVKQHDTKLLVAFNNRFRLDTSIIKSRIERREFGKIRYMKTGWVRKEFSQYRQPWALSREHSGGGAFMDMGIHLIDVCLWLLGYPEVRRVSAFIYGERLDQGIEDGGVALIETEDRVTVVVEVSWGLFLKEGTHYLNIHGERGSAHLNPFCMFGGVDRQIVEKTPKISKSRENIFTESYRHEIEYFGAVLREKTDPPRIEEQVILHEVIDAIYQSSKTGTEIFLR